MRIYKVENAQSKVLGAAMEADGEVDDQVYLVRIHPGSLAAERTHVVVEATKQTTSEEILIRVLEKLKLNVENYAENYFIAEVNQESGQSCLERRLLNLECPVKLQLLWPKIMSDTVEGAGSTFKTNFRFFIRSVNDSPERELELSEMTNIESFVSGFFPHPSLTKEYHDLCHLPDLNEKTLLDNLASRFKQGKIYTYVGSILIAVNPFKFFPIYNPKYVNLYQNHRLGDLPPHIFAIADSAFHTMLQEKKNQCIVISGESGSGKTESTNLLIHHLTALSRKGHASGVEQTLLGAGPVLEAFGNAKTVVNNNSSRFGKFIQINYRENGTVHGAIVEQYLLEKSRIVSQASYERNYHVFYYLLKGASDGEKEKLWLDKPEKFNYLNQSNCYTLEGVDETYEYARLKQSMEMVGFSRETTRRIFSVLSAVLHIGNITFKKRQDHEDYVTVKNIATVKVVSDLLKVKQETLVSALTKRQSSAQGDKFTVHYRMSEAIATRDALAKGLYSALFDWIVLQVNHALLSRYEKKGEQQANSIGVLDIFGFEDFRYNSFEQFCINYANEHLQYYFNQHVFKLEQEEYRREGIIWKDIDFIDNTGCLLLIEKRPTGLLHILNDDCNFPAKDKAGQNLLQKFITEHQRNQYFQTVQIQQEASFVIVHYAGKVKYSIKDFRAKNTDLMRQDIVTVLKNSNQAFVRELVGIDPVAVFRWAIVRAYFRGVQAFKAAGLLYKESSTLDRKHRRATRQVLAVPLQGNEEDGTLSRRGARSKHVSTGTWPACMDSAQGSSSSLSPAILTDPLSPPGRGGQNFHTARPSRVDSYGNSLRRASKVVKRNRSFRGANKPPVKCLKNIKSMKRLKGINNMMSKRPSTKRTPPTVSSQFQISLNKLMESLNQANPFFVRCIKSNSNKEACKLDEALVMRQLRYTGMLETVRIRQSGYNVRLTFEEFCYRYKVLLPKGLKSDLRDIKAFLIKMDLDQKHYQIGLNKVFLRESERVKLQEALHSYILKRIVNLQRWMRGTLQRRRYEQIRVSTITLQAHIRGHICRKKYLQLKEQEMRQFAAIYIQSYWRGYCARRTVDRLTRGVLWFQSYVRGNKARRLLENLLDEREKQREEQEKLFEEAEKLAEEEQKQLEQERLLEQQRLEEQLHNERLLEQQRILERVKEEEEEERLLQEQEKERRIEFELKVDGDKHIIALKDHDQEMWEKRESRDSHLSGMEEVHSSMSDEGILTTDELEEDFERRRTTTMESEESSGILDGSLGSDELLLDDAAGPSDASTLTPTSEVIEPTPVQTAPPKFDTLDRLRGSSRVKLLAQAYQESIHTRSSSPTRSFDESLEDNLSTGEQDTSAEDKALEVANRRGELYKKRTQSPAGSPRASPRGSPRGTPSPHGSPKLYHKRSKINKSPRKLPTLPYQSSTEDEIFKTPSPKSPFFPDQDISPMIPTTNIDLPTSTPNNNRNTPPKNALKKARLKLKKHFGKRKISEPQPPTEPVIVPPLRSSSLKTRYPKDEVVMKRSSRSGSVNRHSGSNMSIHGMSQWSYPTNKLISDSVELQQMDQFLLSKINEVSKTGSGSDSTIDNVFRQAMSKFRMELISTYSVTMQEGNAVALQYKDIISNFENVLSHVAKKQESQGQQQFPITLGINAFRGFLDEFMHQYKPAEKKKEQKKKKEKEKKDEIFEYLGHKFMGTQFNIPTACEYCQSFLWLMEKGQVCQVCKFVCHKKCCTKITATCFGKTHVKKTGRVIGCPLTDLVTDEIKIPIIIERLISAIEINGLYTEGIYRRPGSETKKNELKHRVNTETDIESIDFNSYNIMVVCQVVKAFFREMPESLLTFDLYGEFLRTVEIPTHKEMMFALQDTINKLPEPNFDLFERLVFHLARVAIHEEYNKMSPNGLAIVFAPCLLRCEKEKSPWDTLLDVDKQAQVLEVIIREKVSKLRMALQDISTLETATKDASLRLSEVRRSRREQERERTSQHTSPDVSKKQRSNGHVSGEVEGQRALENVLTEQIRTLEQEKQSLTQDLPLLDLHQAGSDEDNYSTDDGLCYDEDGGLMYEKSTCFEESPEVSKLRHLNKNRAPMQQKRKPARFSRLIPEEEIIAAGKQEKLKRDKKGSGKDKNKKDKKLKKKDSRGLSDSSSVAVV